MNMFAAESVCDCDEPDPSRVVCDYAGGSYICTACGVVLNEQVYGVGREYWEDNYEESKTCKTSYSSSTRVIRNKGVVVYGDDDSTAKHVAVACKHIEELGILFGLGSSHNVVTTAKQLYTDAVAKNGGGLRSRSKNVYPACALYLAFKVEGVHRSIKDFAEASDMSAGIKTFRDLLADKPYAPKLVESATSEDLVGRTMTTLQHTTGLSLDDKIKLTKRVRDIQDHVQQHGLLEGRTPEGVLAGIVWAATLQEQLCIKKKSVHEACGVSGVTLVKAYKELKENLDPNAT